jgi:tetratricopeptide (TPR) repeat protein
MMTWISTLTLAAALLQNFGDLPITIIDTGKWIPFAPTHFDVGPVRGDTLNFHYFPAKQYYEGGRYTDAYYNLNYVLDRPSYIEGSIPSQAFYMTSSYYMRGMILFHHAQGIGALSLARKDFESAIMWDPRNYQAYLELSRLFSTAGLKAQAIPILRQLIELAPGQEIAEEAGRELKRLTTNDGK